MKNIPEIPECKNCVHNFKSIFKDLSEDELNKLSFDKGYDKYKKGTIIYNEGSRMTGCFCINQGIIKLYKTGIEGKEQIIRFAKKGEIIGYRSVLSKETACTTAKVLNDALLCFIPSVTLFELVQTNAKFSMELMQMTCRELGDANSYITDIAQKTVRERLAEILIHLKNEFGLDNAGTLQISLTREELANIVGTATETTIRLLSEFKTDKLIDINGREIKFLNIPGLIKTGNLYE